MGVYGSIQVTKGAELTLSSTDGNVLNIRSAEGMNNDAPDMLNIEGTCNMYSGMTLSGREGNNYFGGGVAVAASYEEISGGLGNLKSSVEILGGKVEENQAKKGAGVFASAYYYAFANAICADTPAAGASKKPGLYVKNAQISDNTAGTSDGMGGGVLVVALKSPAAASIETTNVKENKAATGAGIASYGYYTNMNIKGCTVTENTANKFSVHRAREGGAQGIHRLCQH